MKAVSGHDVKFLQFSDSHLFKYPGDRLIGIDTSASLQAVAALASTEEAVAGVLATGDISQDGSLDSYHHFSKAIGIIDAPVYWVPGNHDDPVYFTQQGTFPLPRRSVIEAGNWRIILLDSVMPGKESGRLSHFELDYIDQHVVADGRHTLLVLHHQPLPCGSAWLDSMILENADDFLNLIATKTSVRAVIHGHIHQASQQRYGDIEFLSAPSTCFQFSPDTDEFSIDRRLPGYRRLLLKHDGSIESEIVRLKDFVLDIDPSVAGY